MFVGALLQVYLKSESDSSSPPARPSNCHSTMHVRSPPMPIAPARSPLVYLPSNSLVPPSTMTAAASRRTYPSSTSQDVSASLAPCSPCDVGSRLWDLTDKSTIHGWLSHHFLHRLAVRRSHSQSLRLNLPDATKAGRTAARIRSQRSCKSLAQNLSSRARNLTSPGKPS